ncbi:uncharacterized protein LOC125940094 [Dermacentor silvarum]|uniref:uncharacterized protein LOC125940094 n=1 Tax=Dermacentor silvarum TaxID=543639 RepID=UPI002100EAB4|nr:uncharacterized protein LOC125940094 [Dermacentor silvarum]
MWEDPKPGSRIQQTRRRVYSVFIRRLSIARKVRRHREKKRSALGPASTDILAITSERATSELQLCSEAELRFRLSITELEKKVVSALKVFSESQGHECTLLDLMNHLQRKTTYARINEMPLPSGEFAVTAPHIITSTAGTCIFGGSHKEIIQVTTGGLERALILCLLVYYIKSLQYPYAFSQMLLLTQKLVLPCEVVPAGATCKRLKSFLALLKKRSIA